MGEDGDEPLDSLSLYIYLSLSIYFFGGPIACNLGLSAASNAENLHFLFETLMRLAVSADPFSLCAIQKVQDALQKLISVQTGPVKTVHQNKLNQCHCPSRVHMFGGLEEGGWEHAQERCEQIAATAQEILAGSVSLSWVAKMEEYKSRRLQISQPWNALSPKPLHRYAIRSKNPPKSGKTCKDLESARKSTGHCWNKTHTTHTFSPVARGWEGATEERAGPCREGGAKVEKRRLLQEWPARSKYCSSSESAVPSCARQCLELTSRAVPFQSPALWRVML